MQQIRTHWQIENDLHWAKGVIFAEGYPCRRGGFAPISWAVLHSFMITLVRRLSTRTVPDAMRIFNQTGNVFHWLT